MEFTFATTMDNNGQVSGIIREGNINENGEISYTKSEDFGEHQNFEELVAEEILRRLYGIDPRLAKNTLKEEVLNQVSAQRGTPTINEAKPVEKPAKQEQEKQNNSDSPVKIGVNVKELSDDEFIEFTKRRVQSNKEFERFKAIKAKIRSTLEGRSHNEHAFNLFVKLHDIDKRGFFNRTQEDNAVIAEAIKLYGAA